MRYPVFVPVLVIAPVANVRPISIVPLFVFGISAQKRVLFTVVAIHQELFRKPQSPAGTLVPPVFVYPSHVLTHADLMRSTISPLHMVIIYFRCGVEILPESEIVYS